MLTGGSKNVRVTNILAHREIDEKILNLRARAARLTEEVAKRAAKLEDEAAKLEALKALALEIGKPMKGEVSSGTIAFGKSGERTADMIEQILRLHAWPLRIDEIIRLIKDAGWRGSGDAYKDYKNVHTNLSTKPKRFRSVSRGLFGLVEV